MDSKKTSKGIKINWSNTATFAVAVVIGMTVFTLVNKYALSKMEDMTI